MRLEMACAALALAVAGCATGLSRSSDADKAAIMSMIEACDRSVPDPRGAGSAQFQACVYDLSEKYRRGRYSSTAPILPPTQTTTRCEKDAIGYGYTCKTE